jgi:hypothetical protein
MKSWKSLLVLAAMAILFAPRTAGADVDQQIRALETQLGEMKAQIAELKQAEADQKALQEKTEHETSVLADTVEVLKNAVTIPEEMKLESRYGLAPAASKVYGKEHGLSIGGYGEAVYRQPVKNTDGRVARSDMQRLILYLGYKFNDWIVLNTEIEFEHASTSKSGSASVEFAYLDFFLHENLNARAGLLLMPMGIINEIHEPVSFFGVDRPEVDKRIIPTTWRENGAGIFGEFRDLVDYRIYAIGSLNGAGFSARGFRGGRQKGSKALAGNWAFVGRADVKPTGGLMLGTSVFTGNTGQNQVIDSVALPDARATIWEIHAQYIWRQLELRSELAMSWLGDSAQLTEALREIGEIGENDVVAKEMLGMYAEVGYDVMPLVLANTDQQLMPFCRYEYVNTQLKVADGYNANNKYQDRIWAIGLNYKPIPQVVLKVDYRNFNPVSGDAYADVNFGIGFIF